jgi:hypothetical protein
LAFSNKDRTGEIDANTKAVQIHPTDICSYYKKHPYTILWKKECWTCAYGDFGIDTGNPTDTGTCKYSRN